MSTGWTIEGVDVRTRGINIREINGWDVFPGKRLDTRVIPYRHGVTAVNRSWYQGGQIALAFTVQPRNASGGVTHPAGAEGEIRKNIDDLFGLFYKDGPISVIKTVPAAAGGTMQREALCHVIDSFDVARGVGVIGRTFIVTFQRLDAFWRELPQNTEVAFTTGNITTGGNAPIADMVVTFTASDVDPRLTDDATGDYIEISGTVPAGGVEVDVGARTVTKLSDGSAYDANLVLGTTGTANPWWMEWEPNSTVALTVSAGDTVNLAWYDKWL